MSAFFTRVGSAAPGTVSIVGAGPGDGGLITVKGAVRLAQADVVLHGMGAASPYWSLLKSDVEEIHVGRKPGEKRVRADVLMQIVVPRARAGKRIVHLRGGDPLIFNRTEEECAALTEAGIAFELVPGITAAVAAAAYVGIAPTHPDAGADVLGLTVGWNKGEAADRARVASCGTLAIYLAEQRLTDICAELLDAGIDGATSVSIVHNATRPGEGVVSGTVGELANASDDLPTPSIVFIGRSASPRPEMAWRKRLPLLGQRVLITRPQRQAAAVAGRLTALGAEVLEAPTLNIEPVDDFTQANRALGELPHYDWIVFTSANGVRAFLKRMRILGMDLRALGRARIAAVGPATVAALSRRMLKADLSPPQFVGESLAESMIQVGVQGQRILLPRAQEARAELPDRLKAAGAFCDDVPFYRVTGPSELPPHIVGRLKARSIDWILFTSPSAFRNLLRALDAETRSALSEVKFASIGPVTTAAIVAADHAVELEAAESSAEGLTNALLKWVAN